MIYDSTEVLVEVIQEIPLLCDIRKQRVVVEVVFD